MELVERIDETADHANYADTYEDQPTYGVNALGCAHMSTTGYPTLNVLLARA
jgi:hypothetical protein